MTDRLEEIRKRQGDYAKYYHAYDLNDTEIELIEGDIPYLLAQLAEREGLEHDLEVTEKLFEEAQERIKELERGASMDERDFGDVYIQAVEQNEELQQVQAENARLRELLPQVLDAHIQSRIVKYANALEEYELPLPAPSNYIQALSDLRADIPAIVEAALEQGEP